MTTRHVTAARAVEMRHSLADWYEGALGTRYAHSLEYERQIDQWTGVTSGPAPYLRGLMEAMGRAGYIRYQRWLTRSAPLYLITDEMQPVVQAAGAKLPNLSMLSAADFPSREGMVVFGSEPIDRIGPEDGERADIVAASWHIVKDGAGDVGLYVDYFEDPDLGEMPPGVTRAPRWLFADLLHCTMSFIPFGEKCPDDLPMLVRRDAIVMSALLMMQQRVVEVEDGRLDRPAQRRLKRHGHDPAVRVVYLRRPASAPSNSQRSVDWTHRWIVNGHWANQWYPSRGVNRPIWIEAYVKGPEGAPLRLRETVRVLSR